MRWVFVGILSLTGIVFAGCQVSLADQTKTPRSRSYQTGALIFNGTGTSDSDAKSLIRIIAGHGLSYKVINSDDLNAMSVDQMARYGVIVWPGGYANQMTNALTQATRRNVQAAVKERGVGFAGFCAGAWMAVGNGIPIPDGSLDLGFSLLPGLILFED